MNATRDAYTQFADAADREYDPAFDELMEEIRSMPVNSDDEKHLRDCLCDQLEMAFARLKPGTKELITENIARGLEDLPSAQAPRPAVPHPAAPQAPQPFLKIAGEQHVEGNAA